MTGEGEGVVEAAGEGAVALGVALAGEGEGAGEGAARLPMREGMGQGVGGGHGVAPMMADAAAARWRQSKHAMASVERLGATAVGGWGDSWVAVWWCLLAPRGGGWGQALGWGWRWWWGGGGIGAVVPMDWSAVGHLRAAAYFLAFLTGR